MKYNQNMLDIFETYFICDHLFQKEISKNFANERTWFD